jgi:hypothetical protein
MKFIVITVGYLALPGKDYGCPGVVMVSRNVYNNLLLKNRKNTLGAE